MQASPKNDGKIGKAPDQTAQELTKPKLDERWLVVLDEAGAVGIDDMQRLFDLAHDASVWPIAIRTNRQLG